MSIEEKIFATFTENKRARNRFFIWSVFAIPASFIISLLALFISVTNTKKPITESSVYHDISESKTAEDFAATFIGLYLTNNNQETTETLQRYTSSLDEINQPQLALSIKNLRVISDSVHPIKNVRAHKIIVAVDVLIPGQTKYKTQRYGLDIVTSPEGHTAADLPYPVSQAKPTAIKLQSGYKTKLNARKENDQPIITLITGFIKQFYLHGEETETDPQVLKSRIQGYVTQNFNDLPIDNSIYTSIEKLEIYSDIPPDKDTKIVNLLASVTLVINDSVKQQTYIPFNIKKIGNVWLVDNVGSEPLGIIK